jgi:DNA replication protein DnaC
VSRDAVVTDLVRQQTRQLKMPGAARAFESLGRQAREEKWSFEDYLHEVFTVELTSRGESAVRQRLRNARFPETKTLDQFDFAAAEGLDAAKIAELARGGWVDRSVPARPTWRSHSGSRLPDSAATWRSCEPPTWYAA